MGLTMTPDGARPMCDLCRQPITKSTEKALYSALAPSLLFIHEACRTVEAERLLFPKGAPQVKTLQAIIADLGEWLL
jgi:hypothetical protein